MREATGAEGSIEPIFVSVKEAARALNISPWSCYQLLDKGAIKSATMGRRRLVYVDSLREYAAELDAGTAAPREPLADRLMRRVNKDAGGCWVWTGARSNGYGRVQVDGTTRIAHRVAFETFVGPIPDDLPLDHLCENRACINPEHLEPVTDTENKRRSMWNKTACRNGHAYDAENTVIDASGARRCRTCRREQGRSA